MGVTQAMDCISGMVNVCLNLQDRKQLTREELEKYTKSYKRLFYGEEGRETKYWFVIVRNYGDTCINMLFGERCIPKKYEIKDKKIWWFQGLSSGKHEDDLFETYNEAKKHLEKILIFEREETQLKIDALNKEGKWEDNYNSQYQRKDFEDVKTVSKCGCES